MPQQPELLTPAEHAQIEAICARLQRSRPDDRREMFLNHALQDALNGALGIADGAFGLAPGSLESAAKTVRDVVRKF